MKEELFIILTSLFICLLVVIIKNKLYREPITFFIIIFTTIFYTPNIFYVLLNEMAYRKFTDDTLEFFLSIAIFSTMVLILCLLSLPKQMRKIVVPVIIKQGSLLWKGIIACVMIGLILYLIRYSSLLPGIQSITVGETNMDRPDTEGNIPHWFTVSSLIYILLPGLLLPKLQMLFRCQDIKSKLLAAFFFLVLSATIVVGGNTSGIAYIVIFIYMYIYEYKIRPFVVVAVGLAFTAYYLLKLQNMTRDGFSINLLAFPIRRFFGTQGACFINRLQMVADGFAFNPQQSISSQVYEFMASKSGGGAPTYFMGDIIVRFGLFSACFSQVAVTYLLGFVSRYIYLHAKGNLFVYWSYAIMTYYAAMGGIWVDSFVYRFVLTIAIGMIAYITNKHNEANCSGRYNKTYCLHGLSVY